MENKLTVRIIKKIINSNLKRLQSLIDNDNGMFLDQLNERKFQLLDLLDDMKDYENGEYPIVVPIIEVSKEEFSKDYICEAEDGNRTETNIK